MRQASPKDRAVDNTSYTERFISNEKIRKLVEESIISIIPDENEVVFHPSVAGMEVGNYYIGSPVDGMDPCIQLRYRGRRYDFYLSEDRQNAVSKITNDIYIMARAFCDGESAYKVYFAESKNAGKLGIIDTSSGKTVSSSSSEGSNVKDRIVLRFKNKRILRGEYE